MKLSSFIKVLKIDPKNLKALFRLAKGQVGIGYLEEAKETLEKALAIEDSAEIRKELQSVSKKIQDSEKKQKKFYGNMLGGLASTELYNEEEIKLQAEADKKAKYRKCNYWLVIFSFLLLTSLLSLLLIVTQ